MKANETADRDFIAQQLAESGDVFLDGDLGVLFHKALIKQAVALIKLVQLAFDDLGDGLRGLVLDLLRGDLPFFVQHPGSDR